MTIKLNTGTDDDVFTTATMITMENLNRGDKIHVNIQVGVTNIVYGLL